jgi:hypothetical protein
MAKMMGVNEIDIVNKQILNAVDVRRDEEARQDARNKGASQTMPKGKSKIASQRPMDRVSQNLANNRQIFGAKNKSQSITEHQSLGILPKHVSNYARF